MKLLVLGAQSATDLPDISFIPDNFQLAFAVEADELTRELPDTDILLLWDMKSHDLQKYWHLAKNLKWIQRCGAGVDAILFDELRNSDVILTNTRGVFDRPMAETVLGYILMVVKDFKTSLEHQQSRTWEYRLSRIVTADKALIVGVGSIGREIARMLKLMGIQCEGVGRSARAGDDEFGVIHGINELNQVAGNFDWVIGIMPSTDDTTGVFDKAFFASMKNSAHFINLGRGTAVVEADLVPALEKQIIAGAMLDVFATEPLPADNPLWQAPNLFITPHISGDYHGFEQAVLNIFKGNLEKFLQDEPLDTEINKLLGFVES